MFTKIKFILINRDNFQLSLLFFLLVFVYRLVYNNGIKRYRYAKRHISLHILPQKKEKEILNMTETEMVLEMLKMQEALDKSVIEEKNVNPTLIQRRVALMDEVGELIHELKSDWCWWKDSQKPIDRQRVLEELVDVWHFALGIEIVKQTISRAFMNVYIQAVERQYTLGEVNVYKLLTSIKFSYVCIGDIFHITWALGFTIEQVFEEYKRKNQINYERLANGY